MRSRPETQSPQDETALDLIDHADHSSETACAVDPITRVSRYISKTHADEIFKQRYNLGVLPEEGDEVVVADSAYYAVECRSGMKYFIGRLASHAPKESRGKWAIQVAQRITIAHAPTKREALELIRSRERSGVSCLSGE